MEKQGIISRRANPEECREVDGVWRVWGKTGALDSLAEHDAAETIPQSNNAGRRPGLSLRAVFV